MWVVHHENTELLERNSPQPQDVVVDRPFRAYFPQVVGGDYSTVVTPLSTTLAKFFLCRRTAARTRRSRTARPQEKPFGLPHIRMLAAAVDYPMNLRTTPCELEVDSHVNYGKYLGKPLVFQGMNLWGNCVQTHPICG